MTHDVLDHLTQIGNLKSLVRSGWVRAGVPAPESVAAHSFRCAAIALALGAQLGVDTTKLIKLLLVHDLAESDPGVGDITPYDGVLREDKYRLELAAMEQLCAGLPNGEELRALWLEYEAGQTPEARVAKQIDLFEMILQSFEYEDRWGVSLAEFRSSADQGLENPVLRALYRQRADQFATSRERRRTT